MLATLNEAECATSLISSTISPNAQFPSCLRRRQNPLLVLHRDALHHHQSQPRVVGISPSENSATVLIFLNMAHQTRQLSPNEDSYRDVLSEASRHKLHHCQNTRNIYCRKRYCCRGLGDIIHVLVLYCSYSEPRKFMESCFFVFARVRFPPVWSNHRQLGALHDVSQ